MNNFLSKLNKVNPSAVILSVIQPFAQTRVQKVIENLPPPMTDLYNPVYELYSLDDLQ